MLVYFGTYSKRGSEGIYVSELDEKAGTLGEPRSCAAIKDPTFLAFCPSGQLLYSVGQMTSGDGGLFCFRRSKTGDLLPIGHQALTASEACHVAVAPDGQTVVLSSYSDGLLESYRLQQDGTLDRSNAIERYQGNGPHPRQDASHVHSCTFDRTGTFAFVADLGTDRVEIYHYASGKLRYAGRYDAAPGSGPRHLACHPHHEWVFILNELDSTVASCRFDRQRHELVPLHGRSTLPDQFTGFNKAAEIAVHPSGRFVYASNRGHDSLVRWCLDEHSGSLAQPEFVSAGGSCPRHFAITPSGHFLIVANTDSDSVQFFEINQASGQLTKRGAGQKIPAPCCVRLNA